MEQVCLRVLFLDEVNVPIPLPSRMLLIPKSPIHPKCIQLAAVVVGRPNKPSVGAVVVKRLVVKREREGVCVQVPYPG